MATVYLRSTDGNDADDGSTWALAKATLAAALTAAGAGGTVYVSQAHAETTAAGVTLTSPGTAASPTRVICVNDGAAPPTALATTATVTVTGNGNNLAFAGFCWSYGVSYIAGATTNSASLNFTSNAAFWWKIENGDLILGGSNAAGRIVIGASNFTAAADWLLELVNVDLKFANTAQGLNLIAPLDWRGGSVDGAGSIPVTLIAVSGAAGGKPSFFGQGLDLSSLGSGKNLFNAAATNAFLARLIDSKLGASVSISTGTHPGQGGPLIEVINADSADTIYRFYRQDFMATETHETTIVRSGGATDGTTTVSRKVVTTANASVVKPYRSMPIEVWLTSLSSQTLSVPLVNDGVTLKDNEAWLEVEYLGTASFPLGVIGSDRVADPIFGTPANQATDGSSTWTTTGLSSPVKQTLDVTFTPAHVGVARVYICVAKASQTLYYDPKVLSTSSRQYMSEAGFVNEGAASAAAHPIIGGSIVRAA